MDDDTHLALGGLALADALDTGATDAGARIKAVETARKHFHAVINRNHGNAEQRVRCVCPDETRGECDCRGECICADKA